MMYPVGHITDTVFRQTKDIGLGDIQTKETEYKALTDLAEDTTSMMDEVKHKILYETQREVETFGYQYNKLIRKARFLNNDVFGNESYDF